MPVNKNINCYGIRRVNPFQGVVQIIDTDFGRSFSYDGENWHIQLMVKDNIIWGSLHRHDANSSYYRYGFWNEKTGLRCLPLDPHLSLDNLNDKSTQLIQLIQIHSQSLPFNLIDNFEYWLLDTIDAHPLALLMSSVEHPKKLSKVYKKWQTQLTDYTSHSQRPEAHALEKQVNERAGYQHRSCWIHRDKSGGGFELESEKTYAATDFPDFLIREDWQDILALKRVSDYINWISPALLTLQNLDKSKREEREKKYFFRLLLC